jgi:hypothetical protein
MCLWRSSLCNGNGNGNRLCLPLRAIFVLFLHSLLLVRNLPGPGRPLPAFSLASRARAFQVDDLAMTTFLWLGVCARAQAHNVGFESRANSTTGACAFVRQSRNILISGSRDDEPPPAYFYTFSDRGLQKAPGHVPYPARLPNHPPPTIPHASGVNPPAPALRSLRRQPSGMYAPTSGVS